MTSPSPGASCLPASPTHGPACPRVYARNSDCWAASGRVTPSYVRANAILETLLVVVWMRRLLALLLIAYTYPTNGTAASRLQTFHPDDAAQEVVTRNQHLAERRAVGGVSGKTPPRLAARPFEPLCEPVGRGAPAGLRVLAHETTKSELKMDALPTGRFKVVWKSQRQVRQIVPMIYSSICGLFGHTGSWGHSFTPPCTHSQTHASLRNPPQRAPRDEF